MQGFGRRAFKLDPPAYKVVLGFSSNALLIDADSHRIRMQTDPAAAARNRTRGSKSKRRPKRAPATW